MRGTGRAPENHGRTNVKNYYLRSKVVGKMMKNVRHGVGDEVVLGQAEEENDGTQGKKPGEGKELKMTRKVCMYARGDFTKQR